MRFRTTIELGGKTASGSRVPPDVASVLGRTSDQPFVTILVIPIASTSFGMCCRSRKMKTAETRQRRIVKAVSALRTRSS